MLVKVVNDDHRRFQASVELSLSQSLSLWN